MSVPDKVYELVEKFDKGKSLYTNANYNEAQLRQEFVNPLFDALGWKTDESSQVLYEAGIRSGGTTKHPDYSFLAGLRRAFYVETKKPSIDIRNAIEPAHQIRAYGWCGNTEIGILTNFKEFAVYDCRIEPTGNDSPSVARELYLTYEEYLDNWDSALGLFTRESVLERKHRQVLEEKPAGIMRVDDSFLRRLESWREELAVHIYKQAKFLDIPLDTHSLNGLVTRTINRIVFLRIIEDRNLDLLPSLESVARATHRIYDKLKSQFRDADRIYNSGLFHFDPKATDRGDADELALNIHINDDVISHIINDLYPPKSLYQFSVISADILGQVYERFLGKVIEVTSNDDVSVEDKPEVRKAGGVYYTPDYIVDYIVENTVGKLLEGRTPDEVAELRVLDPACGSGSFLVGAYQFLLDWHRDYYRQHPARYKNRIIHADEIVLKTTEKKRILLNNIYGVDLDSNAVEVSKLSLLLKMLEGENEAVRREAELGASGEQILPDLGNNIRWGNSLIGSDFYAGKKMESFSEEEVLKVKAFDWDSREHGFGEIMAAGGFDAVIGNPPYIRIQTLNDTAPQSVSYYKEHYFSASKGNYDIYVLFVERALQILNSLGRFGYIVPSKFFATDYGISLRTILAQERLIDHIVDFGHSQVFESATTYTCLLFLSKDSEATFEYLSITPEDFNKPDHVSRTVRQTHLGAAAWTFLTDKEQRMLSKLSCHSQALLDVPAAMSRGSSSGADTIFCLRRKNGNLFTRQGEAVDVEDALLREPIYATDFNRYSFNSSSGELIIFPYYVTTDGYSLIDEDTLKTKYPLTYSYLLSNHARLVKRKQYKAWYSFSAPRNLNVHDNAQLLVPLLANKGLYSLYPRNTETYCLMASGGFSVSVSRDDVALGVAYLLGILNSRLLFWNLRQISNKFRGGWITCTKQYFGRLPIRTIDFNNPADVTLHDQMVELVERMLDLHKQLQNDNLVLRGMIEQQIERTDREIDALVYQLYDLTPAEIAIVEGRDA